jgi:hypothetical protein
MNLIQSWKQSLSLLAPANFAQFVRDLVGSTLKTYQQVMQCWYRWLVPCMILVFAAPLREYMKTIFENHDTTWPDTVRIMGTHITQEPSVGLGVLLGLIGVMLNLWIFGIIYGCVSMHTLDYHVKTNLIFRRFAPIAVVFYVILALLPVDTIAFAVGKLFFERVVSWWILLAPLTLVAMVILGPFNAAFLMFFSVLYARYLVIPEVSLWVGFKKTITGIWYILPAIIVLASCLFFGAWMARELTSVRYTGATRAEDMQFLIHCMYYVTTIGYYLLLPAVITIWAQFYARQLREQPDLYFDVPK